MTDPSLAPSALAPLSPAAAEPSALPRWYSHAYNRAELYRLAAAMWLHTVPRIPVPGKRAGPIGYLTNVYVEPAHRNAGLGAEMVDQVTVWCRTEGFSTVIVWPTARSRSFSRRGGFSRLEEPLVLDVEPDTPLER